MQWLRACARIAQALGSRPRDFPGHRRGRHTGTRDAFRRAEETFIMSPFFAALIAVGYMATVFVVFGFGPRVLPPRSHR
jgi:hypothetical protein